MPSVFATFRNAQNAPPPDTQSDSVFAPIPDEPMQQSDTKVKSLVNHLGGEQGHSLGPIHQDPEAEQIAHDQQALEKVRWNQENPWGSPENHPGKLGKIAHAFSVLGNVAGNVFAPAVMANVPGTEAHMQAQEAGLSNRLNKEAEEESQNKERGGETAHLAEETAEMPGKTASEEGLQKVQTEEGQQKLDNGPDLAMAYAHAVNQEIKSGRDPGQSPVVQQLQDAITGIQKQPATKAARPDTPEQQFLDEYMNKLHPGSTVADAEKAYNLLPKYQQPPQTQFLIPQEGGGYKSQAVRPGSTVAENAISPTGLNTINTPTSQSRNMAEMAQTVLPQMKNVTTEIDQMAQSLGPAVGRWNQLMTNKGGTDFPQFAKLDTDLDLLASAVVRTHFGARGGQQYREELRKMFGEAQSPEDLKARISAANGWLQGYAHMAGKGGAEETPTTEPKVLKFNPASGRLE